MDEFVLSRNLTEALTDAASRHPSLGATHAKLRAVLESYALSIGLTESKLRVLDICDDRACVSKPFRRFIFNDYPATDAYRRQINSRVKNIIRALTGVSVEEAESDAFSLLTRGLPEYMIPMLPFLPRDIKGGFSHPNNAKSRLTHPVSERGLHFLSACLDVHREYKISTLEELLCQHSSHIISACGKLFGRRQRDRCSQTGTVIRKGLRLRLPDPDRLSLPKEQWPRTLRAEWEAFAEKAVTDGSSFDELAGVEVFGFETNAVKESTIENREWALAIALGFIVPHARSLRVEDFGVEDLLRIEHGTRSYNGKDVPFDFNPLVEVFRQREKGRSSEHKRSNRDSAMFQQFVSAVKRLGVYSGNAHLVETFGNAYKKQKPDTHTKEARKAIRLATYTSQRVDRRIEVLGERFYEVVKSGAYKKDVSKRDTREADAYFNFCVYYVSLLVLRFLGYRQQCLRDCKVGENITFNRDGSITFFWPKGKIKNQKPIKVVLDAKKRPYQKNLVNALWLYYRKVYPYVRQWSARQGKLGLLGDQFFLHTNLHREYACFPERRRGVSTLYSWWTRLTEQYMNFDELGITDRLPFNPHFLCSFCINWMKFDLGLSDDEVAEAVGDTVAVVKREYISRERVHDATPITDKIADIFRKRDEREVGIHERLKQQEEAHATEVANLRGDRDSWKHYAERADKRIEALEADLAALRTNAEGRDEIIKEQKRQIGELEERLDALTASGGTTKRRRHAA